MPEASEKQMVTVYILWAMEDTGESPFPVDVIDEETLDNWNDPSAYWEESIKKNVPKDAQHRLTSIEIDMTSIRKMFGTRRLGSVEPVEVKPN